MIDINYWRYNPFTQNYQQAKKTDEIYTVQFYRDLNMYGVKLKEAARLFPDIIVKKLDNTIMRKSIRYYAPSAGEYRPDYDAQTYFRSNFIQFNSADNGLQVKITYYGTGTVASTDYNDQIIAYNFDTNMSGDFYVSGNLNVGGKLYDGNVNVTDLIAARYTSFTEATISGSASFTSIAGDSNYLYCIVDGVNDKRIDASNNVESISTGLSGHVLINNYLNNCVGVSRNGKINYSNNSGQTWINSDTITSGVNRLVNIDNTFAISTADGVYVSNDYTTWTKTLSKSNAIIGVNRGQFVAVSNNTMSVSDDAITWTDYTMSGTPTNLHATRSINLVQYSGEIRCIDNSGNVNFTINNLGYFNNTYAESYKSHSNSLINYNYASGLVYTLDGNQINYVYLLGELPVSVTTYNGRVYVLTNSGSIFISK